MSDSKKSYSYSSGISAGAVIGMLLSWAKWHSVMSLIWPGLFSWFYVIYFAIKYGTNF